MSFPERLTIVEVIGPDEAAVTAEIIAEAPTGVTVEWGGDAPAPGAASARWPSTRGLCVMPCTVSANGRYGLLEATSEPMVLQRRGAVRVDMIAPVRRLDGGHPWQVARTVNVSAKGLLIKGDLSLEAGSVAVFGIELPDCPSDPLQVTGRVLSVEDELMRVEFLELKEAQEDRLVHLVFERQRVALRSRHNAPARLRLVED